MGTPAKGGVSVTIIGGAVAFLGIAIDNTPNKPGWVPIVLYVTAAGLALLGLSWGHLPHALGWMRAVHIRSPFFRPADALMTGGSGSAPNVAQTQAEHDREVQFAAMRERIKFAEFEEQEHEKERANWQRMEAEKDKRISELTDRNAALSAEVKSDQVWREYGATLPRLEALSDADLTAAREHIAELKPTLKKAHKQAYDLMLHYLERMANQPPTTSAYWLMLFLNQHLKEADRARTLLLETIETKGDARPVLAMWYSKYRWVCLWVARLMTIHGEKLAGPEYEKLYREHNAFMTAFNNKLEVERLAALATHIRMMRKFTEDWFEPPPPKQSDASTEERTST
jgi:hypothetical protein